jgi:predicted membrane-bound mannosyltransferase
MTDVKLVYPNQAHQRIIFILFLATPIVMLLGAMKLLAHSMIICHSVINPLRNSDTRANRLKWKKQTMLRVACLSGFSVVMTVYCNALTWQPEAD